MYCNIKSYLVFLELSHMKQIKDFFVTKKIIGCPIIVQIEIIIENFRQWLFVTPNKDLIKKP